LSMLGTRSLAILSGNAASCPVRPRFQANTAASVTGARASWLAVTYLKAAAAAAALAEMGGGMGWCGVLCGTVRSAWAGDLVV
jgi:hypothetical protein